MALSIRKVIVGAAFVLSIGRLASSQTIYPAATVTITGFQTGAANGTMTIAFNGHTHTVSYGQFSTASSIASAFAAEFSSYPALAWPRLCTIGVCAKANGSTIKFQLKGGASFGPITVTSAPTTGTNPFGAIVPTPSNVSLISSANPSTFETQVTFTATVPNGATGNVIFYDGTNSLGSVTISGTTASYTISSLAVGSHSVTAVYSGDGNYAGSASGLMQIVDRATPSVTLATSGTPSTHGASVTFTATVFSTFSISPTGYVTFFDSGAAIGQGQISGTMATMTTSSLAAGTHSITATYSGDTNFAAITSSALAQVVEGIVIPGPGIIATLAGINENGYDGDGILATNADLYVPFSVAIDTTGNAYIADTYNQRIRKVSASTGMISTLAGNGIAGYNGDGILATNAELGYPASVALDASGNIYIADEGSQRIRKVTYNNGVGTITTVAGNGMAGYNGDGILATNAELDNPASVALDASGNIYIADYGNNRIRKVTYNNGVGTITTVAGNGTRGYNNDAIPATSAELSMPDSVAVDASGNIYIADYGNNRIRKVTYSNGIGIITTVAGNGTPGYNGDDILATSAELYQPSSVAVDMSGNIYIADLFNQLIRKVIYNNGIGTITTIIGNGKGGYNGDGILATTAELFYPESVAVDTFRNIYLADTYNARIRVVGAPAVSVNCSPNPVAYGGSDPVCTASISGGVTGTVSLTYNGTTWVTLPLINGSAAATWPSTVGVGTFNIVATYNGDQFHATATGSTVLHIGDAAPTVAVSSSVNSILLGQSSVLTATISNGLNPTGTVTFQINGANCCTANVSNGVAVYSGSNEVWSLGSDVISAVYGGDSQNQAATGTTIETVNATPIGPTSNISLSSSSGYPGSSVTITGLGFGNTQASNSAVTIGGQNVAAGTWSDTSITVTIPYTQVAASYQIAVIVNGTQVGQAPFLVTPKIISLSLTQGPPQVGLVINGLGFGPSTNPLTVTLSNFGQPLVMPIIGVAANSDSVLTVQVPASAQVPTSASAQNPPETITVKITPSGGSPITSNPVNFTVTLPIGCPPPTP